MEANVAEINLNFLSVSHRQLCQRQYMMTCLRYVNKMHLLIQAEYLDLKEWFSPIPAAVSSSKNYIQAMVLTERPIVNQDVEVFVNCSEPLQYISYELLGRGDVIAAHTLQVRNEHTHWFHFTATHAMVPTAHLIVSYVRSEGEIVADSLDIEIDGLLQNFVRLFEVCLSSTSAAKCVSVSA